MVSETMQRQKLAEKVCITLLGVLQYSEVIFAHSEIRDDADSDESGIACKSKSSTLSCTISLNS